MKITPVYFRNPDRTLNMIEVETDDPASARRTVEQHFGENAPRPIMAVVGEYRPHPTPPEVPKSPGELEYASWAPPK